MKRVLLLIASAVLPTFSYASGTAAWIAEVNVFLSSMRIATMQQSSITDKVGSSKVQAAQASASAAIDRYNREQIRRIWNDYGTNGQLVDPCYQVNLADTTAQIKTRTDTNAANAASLVYRMSDDGQVASSGLTGFLGGTTQRTATPYAASVAKRVARHHEKYCSVAESAAGYCTLQPNGMQTGDADFSLHFAPGQTYGWDQTEAATDFVKTVAPVKPMPVASKCNTPACLDALKSRRAEEAYLSMSRFSFLRFVESRSSQATGEAKQAVNK